MSDYLLGNDDTTFADNYDLNYGYAPEAYAIAYARTCTTTGTVTDIEAYLKTVTDLESFTLRIDIYSDSGGEPGGRLGTASVTGGNLASFTWVTVPGFDVDVTEGETYWLVPFCLEFGVSIGFSSGSTVDWSGTNTRVPEPPDPWADSYLDSIGKIGVRALGTPGEGGSSGSGSTGLEFHLTGIIPFGETTPPYYGRIGDPQAGEVVIPLNDSRTASVTVSAYDPVVETLAGLTQVPYAVHLKAYYNGRLVFWGPCKVRGGDFVAGTVRLDAVDMSLRLIKHFIREGDVTLEGTVDADTGEGSLPISHIGMRLLRDAGDTLSFPPLGIDDGVNTYAPETVGILGVRRGDQVWNTITQMQQALGPDFELEPRDDADGFYAQLNTYDRQGVDVSPTVQMHFGTGRQNLESLSFTEGEEYVNLAHVLDKDLLYRETRANAAAIGRTGPYIYWDTTDFDTSHTTEADSRAVLDARADDLLDAYSDPLVALNLTLFPDTPDGYHYLDDYGVGDTIGVAGRVGFLELPEAPYRVMKVTLSKDGESDRQSLEVVADRTITIDGSDT